MRLRCIYCFCHETGCEELSKLPGDTSIPRGAAGMIQHTAMTVLFRTYLCLSLSFSGLYHFGTYCTARRVPSANTAASAFAAARRLSAKEIMLVVAVKRGKPCRGLFQRPEDAEAVETLSRGHHITYLLLLTSCVPSQRTLPATLHL